MNKKELTWRIRVYGIVQGVGFRPTVSRHATSNGICGTVCNKGPYVEIYAQGQKKQMEGFLKALEVQPPKRAAILKINTEDVTAETDMHFETFDIIESEKTKGEIFVSPDIAICEECKEEMYDPKDRRYLHPFINCTCCGPRLTILDALPYDRERTSMKEFPMCPDCAEEYEDETTRRYDAQPVCCNKCGPEVYLIGRSERGRDAITYTRRMISEGKIVAIKGIGGFHLCCDATNEEAVQRLRTLKRRPAKPFAVMAKDESVVKRECVVTPEQEMILTGHQKPILLLDKENGGRLAPSIAPGNPKVGVMLPYAPVQLLIFQYDDGIKMPDILVMTSGNTSGAPICREDTEAVAELSHLCDAMLSHNRKIRIRADDTVMDFYKNEPYMIRRSRGYAPLPFMMSTDWKGKVLAVGGELKNTFCIGVDSRFYPSPYVGDLEDLRTVKALQETIQRFQTLLEVHPQVVVCDLHPKYNSTVVAEELGYPIVKVQHHYAHILSCMVENDCQEPVIGVAFDGTGYGTDGTIWGGEILLADYEDFTRFGNITPFLQIGGDVSAKEGWRIAVSMIYGYTKDRELAGEIMKKLDLCSEKESKVQFAMADRKLNAVLSTSVGRLFDAVSAILGIRHKSSFEGEASMALEFAAEAYEQKDHEQKQNEKIDPLVYEEDGHVILNTQLLVQRIVEAKLQGADSGRLAYWFHEILAEQITAVCVEARNVSGRQKAVLSGGVFQKKDLKCCGTVWFRQMTEESLSDRRHMVWHNYSELCTWALNSYSIEWEAIKMCVGLSAKVVKISNGTAVIDAGGAKREVSAQLLEDLEPGDYVMVHAGVAIAKITEEDDSETEHLMEEFLQ